MAYKKFQVRRGLDANLPKLAEGEFGFCTDTKELYIGSNSGNVIVTGGGTNVPWATGSDEAIVEMVRAADRGDIKLSDYWSVGDERTITLPAMAATNVGETHKAQEVTLVLLNAGGKTLANGKECSFIVGLKDLLNESGYMNSTHSNSGSWESSKRRAWCNNEFKNAMFATGIGAIFKQHLNITAKEYNATELTTSTDWFALAAAKEIFGGTATEAGSATYNSNLTEFQALTQFEYYKTASNRVKQREGAASNWWERSPDYVHDYAFLRISPSGSQGGSGAEQPYNGGLAPFGCI